MFSSEVNALYWAPRSSKSRLTSNAVRRGVPLKTMCSRKWLTPATWSLSSRLPARTKKPAAMDAAVGVTSATIVSWLSSSVCLNSVGMGGYPLLRILASTGSGATISMVKFSAGNSAR